MNVLKCLFNNIGSWEEEAIQGLKELKPDLIVCDVVSRVGAVAADKMRIPSVLNWPA
jgi:hypothetical protein